MTQIWQDVGKVYGRDGKTEYTLSIVYRKDGTRSLKYTPVVPQRVIALPHNTEISVEIVV